MSILIRPALKEDYVPLAQTANLAFPGVPHTADGLEEDDTVPPPCIAQRLVAQRDGVIVGGISYFQLPARYDPRKFWLDFWVDPEHQRNGIGSAMFDHVMAAIAPHDPVLVRTFTREDLLHSVQFLERRGFTEGKRTWESRLDLTTFDLGPYAGVEEKARVEGIVIQPLATLQASPTWKSDLLDLYNTIQADVPDIDPAVALTPEQFEQQLQSPRLLPEGYLIARDGERWVGLSSLWKSEDPERIDVGLTGVRREYRGRGIARALKVRGIRYAREQGYKRMQTHNASTNRPMLAINERLGFMKQPAWLHMLRHL